ncbi:MAG: response regulator transcription factor [Clostridiales bacterium]|nr:response regulator transcription factor [Clostridiales bacterium]
MPKKVLIVDDETNIVEMIAYNLKKESFEVLKAYDGEEALKKVFSEDPDIILLDVMMPVMDGLDACRKIRETRQTPIIMITARADEVDKVLGLELGADDYITKPFGIRELIARVKANLRRSVQPPAKIEDKKGLVFDFNKCELRKNGSPIDLTLREFELLKFMSEHADTVFSREELLEKVWNYEFYGDVRNVDVTVRRIRSKIEDNPESPRYLLTRRGLGYYFTFGSETKQ